MLFLSGLWFIDKYLRAFLKLHANSCFHIIVRVSAGREKVETCWSGSLSACTLAFWITSSRDRTPPFCPTSSMPFFSGAQNVEINGGHFEEHHNNQTLNTHNGPPGKFGKQLLADELTWT